jgi:hypothetical protein
VGCVVVLVLGVGCVFGGGCGRAARQMTPSGPVQAGERGPHPCAYPCSLPFGSQVFPVEFHYRTLEPLLGMLRNLVPNHEVVKACFVTLLQRIQADMLSAAAAASTSGSSAGSSGGPPGDVDVFHIFLQSLHTLASDAEGPFKREAQTEVQDASPSFAVSEGLAVLRTTMAALANSGSIGSLIDAFDAVMQFTLAVWPGNIGRIDEVMDGCSQSLQVRAGRFQMFLLLETTHLMSVSSFCRLLSISLLLAPLPLPLPLLLLLPRTQRRLWLHP